MPAHELILDQHTTRVQITLDAFASQQWYLTLLLTHMADLSLSAGSLCALFLQAAVLL